MLTKVKKIFNLLLEIKKLQIVKIRFSNYNKSSLENYKSTYNYFTKLHRLKIFRNKTIGVSLIDLNRFDNFDDYYKSINGKNSSAYYSRKALKREYKFVEIDRNNYIDDIYKINTSSTVRQGKRMGSSYLIKQSSYKDEKNYRYFGVIDRDNRLVSYCNIGFYGEFSLVSTLLGDKKHLNNGVMYLMMVELNRVMFNKYRDIGYRYIMYDTFFGASEGLKKFKQKLGYRAYRVKWSWEN